MQKIPTLFKRNPDDRSKVMPEITPGCEWVIADEGTPTRKYDGTCVLYDPDPDLDHDWWARREVKADKVPPLGWRRVTPTDEATGKAIGWEPMDFSPFRKFHAEALDALRESFEDAGQPVPDPTPGTYELIGPKINGNPEDVTGHQLVVHEAAEPIWWVFGAGVVVPVRVAFAMVRDHLIPDLVQIGAEGVVWNHPDGRMAKIKVRDFR